MAVHKWEINENYFDDIDTAEKAYFLGFLYADGYNNVKKHEIKIRLSIQDEELLIKFRNILYPNQDRPLQYSIRNGNHSYCELYVSNKRLSDSLAKHGCVQAKLDQAKHTTELPDSPDYNTINEFVASVNERIVKGEI